MDIHKTAITTPFGLFEFVCMVFRLCNAAQTFHRFIDQVLCGLHFCYDNIDDVLVASANAEEYEKHKTSPNCVSTRQWTWYNYQSRQMRIGSSSTYLSRKLSYGARNSAIGGQSFCHQRLSPANISTQTLGISGTSELLSQIYSELSCYSPSTQRPPISHQNQNSRLTLEH